MEPKIRRYWLVHIFSEGTEAECFRIFTDISLLMRSIQKHVRKEPDAHSTWQQPHIIYYVCEEPQRLRDVTVEMTLEAEHAVFNERVFLEEEPSPAPIFAAGIPL